MSHMFVVIWCCLNPRATAMCFDLVVPEPMSCPGAVLSSDCAEKLRSKAPQFEAHSKQQETLLCLIITTYKIRQRSFYRRYLDLEPIQNSSSAATFST
nr:hypothetical protein CFP56_08767 [Quercus suber]